MNAGRFCFSFCFAKSHICTYFGRTFHETVFHFDLLRRHNVRVVSFGQTLQHRKKAISNCLCASEMIMSNKPSIHLCAEAADAATFCFCFWELFNFYVNQNSGACQALVQCSVTFHGRRCSRPLACSFPSTIPDRKERLLVLYDHMDM